MSANGAGLSRTPKTFTTSSAAKGADQGSATAIPVDSYVLDLPSLYTFYPTDSVSCGRVTGLHQSKFYRAHQESRTRYLVDAVNSLLSGELSAWDFSYQDFVWTLYWIRLNQYTSVPLVYNGKCQNAAHIHKVNLGDLPESSLHTAMPINKTKLKETLFKEEAVTELLEKHDFSFLLSSNFRLHTPTIRDVVTLEEEFVDMENYSELEYLADFAFCIRTEDSNHGNTTCPADLKSRIDFVSNLYPNQLAALDEYRKIISNYGITESVTFKCGCKECGAEEEVAISISAQSFL